MFEYAFDLNNNLTKLAVLTANGTSTTNYTYGKDNQPDTVTFNNGATLSYNYDTLGRNNKVTINTTNPIETSYYYHSYTDENGKKHNSNLLGLESSKDFSYRYVYNDRNNITVVQEVSYDADGNAVYTPIEEYTYDELNQLTRVDYLTQNKRVIYLYDLGGNISKERIYSVDSNGTATLVDTKSYVYGDMYWKDKLTTYDGQAITYDNIGNPLTYRDGFTFTWSNGRQLQSLTKDGVTVNYTYDDSGMRLSKTVDGVEYTYLYQDGLLIQETVGTRILDYSYDANGRLAMVRYRIPENNYDKCFYYALNSCGDVIGLYSDTGTLIAKYNYDVWGNVLSETNATGGAISDTHVAKMQSFRYRSYYYDKESNFYYLQSRYYDPVTHRFINADGLINCLNIVQNNLYTYCKNNPIKYIDYNGLDAVIALDSDGPGHIGILIENSNGEWGHFYWGAADLSVKGIACCAINIDVSANAWFIEYSGDINLESINSSDQYSGDYEKIIKLKGDFSESYAQALNCANTRSYSSKEYNLYTNNCSNVSFSILSESKTDYSDILSAASKKILPSKAYKYTKRRIDNTSVTSMISQAVSELAFQISKALSSLIN